MDGRMTMRTRSAILEIDVPDHREVISWPFSC